jgi:hypothetical protein
MQRVSGRFYMGSGTRAQGEGGVQEIIGARRHAELAAQRPGWAGGKVRRGQGRRWAGTACSGEVRRDAGRSRVVHRG